MAQNFKVISASNFNDETFAESQAVVPHLTEDQAKRIADILNENMHETDRTYYRAVPADRKLWRGMEEFV